MRLNLTENDLRNFEKKNELNINKYEHHNPIDEIKFLVQIIFNMKDTQNHLNTKVIVLIIKYNIYS